MALGGDTSGADGSPLARAIASFAEMTRRGNRRISTPQGHAPVRLMVAVACAFRELMAQRQAYTAHLKHWSEVKRGWLACRRGRGSGLLMLAGALGKVQEVFAEVLAGTSPGEMHHAIEKGASAFESQRAKVLSGCSSWQRVLSGEAMRAPPGALQFSKKQRVAEGGGEILAKQEAQLHLQQQQVESPATPRLAPHVLCVGVRVMACYGV